MNLSDLVFEENPKFKTNANNDPAYQDKNLIYQEPDTGNVGIGFDGTGLFPTSKLHVFGEADKDLEFRLQNSDSKMIRLFLNSDNSTGMEVGGAFNFKNGVNRITLSASGTSIMAQDGSNYLTLVSGGTYVNGDLWPTSGKNLGSSSFKWNNFYLGGTIYNSAFTVSDGTRNRLVCDSSLSGIYSPNGNNYLYANDSFTVSNGHFVPKTTATFSLGVSTYRWNNLYMTGKIYSSSTLYLNDGTRDRFYYDGTSTSLYSPDGNSVLSVSNSYINVKGRIEPNSNESYDLGRSTYKWNATYTNYLYASKINITYSGTPITTSYSSSSIYGGGIENICTGLPVASVNGISANIFNGYASNGMIYHIYYYNGVIYVGNTSTTLSGVMLNRGATSWSSTSDKRMKENIKDIPYGLAEIKRLNPVSFNYINYTGDESLPTDVKLGLLAQDAYAVIPEVVTKGSDEEIVTKEDIANIKTPWGVDYTSLIPVLIKSVQELSAKVETLEAQIK